MVHSPGLITNEFQMHCIVVCVSSWENADPGMVSSKIPVNVSYMPYIPVYLPLPQFQFYFECNHFICEVDFHLKWNIERCYTWVFLCLDWVSHPGTQIWGPIFHHLKISPKIILSTRQIFGEVHIIQTLVKRMLWIIEMEMTEINCKPLGWSGPFHTRDYNSFKTWANILHSKRCYVFIEIDKCFWFAERITSYETEQLRISSMCCIEMAGRVCVEVN